MRRKAVYLNSSFLSLLVTRGFIFVAIMIVSDAGGWRSSGIAQVSLDDAFTARWARAFLDHKQNFGGVKVRSTILFTNHTSPSSLIPQFQYTQPRGNSSLTPYIRPGGSMETRTRLSRAADIHGGGQVSRRAHPSGTSLPGR